MYVILDLAPGSVVVARMTDGLKSVDVCMISTTQRSMPMKILTIIKRVAVYDRCADYMTIDGIVRFYVNDFRQTPRSEISSIQSAISEHQLAANENKVIVR